ncbi:hypothetical protein BKA80DRAFT_59499 [Phyllosticta citrichinensis]
MGTLSRSLIFLYHTTLVMQQKTAIPVHENDASRYRNPAKSAATRSKIAQINQVEPSQAEADIAKRDIKQIDGPTRISERQPHTQASKHGSGWQKSKEPSTKEQCANVAGVK